MQKQSNRSSVFWSLFAVILSLIGFCGHAGTQFSAGGMVYSLALQVDGKILIGGLIGQQAIARLNMDGTFDTEFTPNVGGQGTPGVAVYAIAVQPDEKILIGGAFTLLNGQGRTNFGRLNSDGTLDTSFTPPGAYSESEVHAVAIQPDGKILATMIGRVNADGTVDTGFQPGVLNGMVLVALQDDGKILVSSPLCRLNPDGTRDRSFTPEPYGPNAVLVQPDGKILIATGGAILRLNSDGTLDGSFFAPKAEGVARVVMSLALQSDGKILVGGGFYQLAGEFRTMIARLKPDGTLDPSFNSALDSAVRGVALRPSDGTIIAVGQFHSGIAWLNNTGCPIQSLYYDHGTITWLRDGTSPEVWRTAFDVSTNGTDWVGLGAGSRIPGGWELRGAVIPTNSIVRGRGFVSGTEFSGSSWFVEATAEPPKLQSCLELRSRTLQLMWPMSLSNLYLFSTTSLAPPVDWQLVTSGMLSNGFMRAYVPATDEAAFFQLRPSP